MTGGEGPSGIKMPASVPTREGERIANAAEDGARSAVEGARRSVRVEELRLRLPAGTDTATIARAVRRALMGATGGRR
jgi:hypothetical protein